MKLLIDDLADRVRKLLPMHARFLDKALVDLRPQDHGELDEYLVHCRRRGATLDHLAECYATVVEDTYLAQIHFRRTGRYQHSSFAEVEKIVYANPVYMEKYMYGLAITSFLWPNHRQMHDFFSQSLPSDHQGIYLEVGPGHGYFLLRALRQSSFQRFLAVDVSAKSIELARSLCEALEPKKAKTVAFQLADFLTSDLGGERFDFVVMGEVLEHVEQPQLFLNRLFELTRPSGAAFITTCVNSPAIDHISLFVSGEQVEIMIAKAGFTLKDKLEAPYVGKTLADSVTEKLPINVAYSLVRP